MKFSLCAVVVSVVFITGLSSSHAQTQPGENSLIESLLSLPAPPPGWQESKNYELSTPEARLQRYIKNCEISTPLDLFMKCWSHKGDDSKRTDAVITRIAENYKNFPHYLTGFLDEDLIAENEASFDKIKSLYDECQQKDCGLGESKKHWLESVQRWLMMHSRYFRQELIAKATQIQFNEQYEYVENKEYLNKLAELDWRSAEPIVNRALDSNNEAIRMLGEALQFINLAQNYPEKFQSLKKPVLEKVFDGSWDKELRKNLVARLLKREWPGRDEFYLNLFKTDAYKWLEDNYSSVATLHDYIAGDPEKWIPILGKFINSKNRNLHNNAVTALLGFQREKARKDALTFLLPWLTDPDWSDSDEYGRLRVIQSMDDVIIEESVPGLIWVVENDPGEFPVIGAAEALALYDIKPAAPAIKKRLYQLDTRYRELKNLIKAVYDLGGFNSDEISNALKAYIQKVSTEEGARDFKKVLGPLADLPVMDRNILIGYWLTQNTSDLGNIAEHIFASQPASESLVKVIARWNDPAIDRELLRLLEEGKLASHHVHSMLNRRKTLAKPHGKVLSGLIRPGKEAGGIAAVLLSDQKAYATILTGSDPEAQKGLLASARLIREPLDIHRVAVLLKSSDSQLVKAAREYLIAEDSPKARTLVFDNAKGEIMILGARMSFDPGHFSNNKFDHIEDMLMERFRKEKDITEVYALLSAGYWGDDGQVIVVVRKNKMDVINMQGWGKYRKRTLSKEEYKKIQDHISSNHIDDLPPLNNMIHDGIQYEYVHMKKNFGRRVFMNNPETQDPTYTGLVTLFRRLLKSGDFATLYQSVNNNAGAKMLPKSKRPVEWTRFSKKYQQTKEDCAERLSHWQSRYQNRPVYGDFDGLFSCAPKTKWKKDIFFIGKYSQPVVTPDNKWIVTSKVDTNWSAPNYVVIINMDTKEERRVNLETADNFNPVAYLENQGKILLERYRDGETYYGRKPVGPQKPVHYLLDPETGKTEEVAGNFIAWNQHYSVPLKKAAVKNQLWLAVPRIDENRTYIGLYDALKFRFQEVQIIESQIFNSANMWVDEANGWVWVDPGNPFEKSENILRFPLKLPKSPN